MKSKYCIICGTELQGSQRMFCSGKCKQKHHYNLNSNPNSIFSQNLRGYRRKLKLINLRGGKCEKCGYDKNLSALEFHHIDSNLKEFPLDLRNLSNNSWDNILSEFKKCLILCSNCHKELHHPEYTKENIEKLISEQKDLNEITHYKECKFCKKLMPKTNYHQYCSDECKNNAKKQRFDKYPSIEELEKMYKELKSWEQVAKHFNITRKIIQNIRKNNNNSNEKRN